jgi:pimeloyl-ACP methyl ester carboxylesterase
MDHGAASSAVQQRQGPGGIRIDEIGEGPRIVFVHGGGMGGRMAWRAQLPLAARWRLVMPYRLGYDPSPPAPREDFEVDALYIADLLEDGAHLVGHSYGGAVALLAAARRPEAVWSLTVIESGSSGVARGTPVVDEFERALGALTANPPRDPAVYVRAVFGVLEPSAQLPDPLPPPLLDVARRLTTFRWPSEAVIPVDVLAAAPFRKLWISGGHSAAYEAIMDALAQQVGGQREIIPGGGHSPQQVGDVFNALLETFLTQQTTIDLAPAEVPVLAGRSSEAGMRRIA